jgi:putative phage-type endonuclease
MIRLPYKSHEEWLELRRSGIGGSDIGAIFGLHNYMSVTGLWLDKLHRSEPQVETEAMTNGKLWEDIIRQRYIRESGNNVEKPMAVVDGKILDCIYQSEKYPFMLASIDGEGIDPDGKKFIFEAKNTLNFNTIRDLEDDETPLYWVAQVLHYLIVTDYDYAVIAYQAGNSHHGTRIIERNPENEARIIEAETEFWGYVTNSEPPKIDGSDEMMKYLADTYNNQIDETTDLSPIGDKLERQYLLGREIKAKEAERSILTAEIKSALGNYKYGNSRDYNASWSRSAGTKFDADRFKKENPDIVLKYTIPTETNTLRITEVKNGK